MFSQKYPRFIQTLGMTKYSFRHRQEFELIVACVRFSLGRANRSELASLALGGVDWHAFIRQALRHRVVPQVHDVLSRGVVEAAPRFVHERMTELETEVVRKNLRLAAELIRIVRAFDEASIAIVSFKGPTLASDLYGGLHGRQFVDLDLLIDPCDLRVAMKLFDDLGYRARATPLQGMDKRQLARVVDDSKSYELLRDDRYGSLAVDLHWRLSNDDTFFRTTRETRDGGDIRVKISSEEVATLSPVDLTYYLAYHGGYHRWSRLSWLCDLAWSLRRVTRPEMKVLLDESVPANNRRYLIIGMLLLERLRLIDDLAELIDTKCRRKLAKLSNRSHYVLSADEAVPLLGVLSDGLWRYQFSGEAWPLANSLMRFFRPKQRDLAHRGVIRPYLSRWQYILSRAFTNFRG